MKQNFSIEKFYNLIKKNSKNSKNSYNKYYKAKFQNFFRKSKFQEIIFLFLSVYRQNQLIIFENKDHKTNIFDAIKNNDIESVQFLLENDFYSINDVNKEGISIISYCLEYGDKNIYNYLISKNPTIEFSPLKEKPKNYEPNIFKACKEGNLGSVQWLIEKENEDKNKKVEEDNWELEIFEDDTPIHIASKNGNLPIVQYLIEKQNVDIDIKGLVETTPLQYACKEGHLPIVKYLISKGANTKTKKPDTIINYACQNGHLAIVQYLIENKIIDINFKGDSNRTPLSFACFMGHLQIAEYLISKGANIHAKDDLGNYVIHEASSGGLLSIVQYLIEKQNVDKDIKGYDDETPLHCACKGGHLSIVEYLISKGANIEAKTDLLGQTPLHIASSNGRTPIVKYLISKGANKYVKDTYFNGETPYELAKDYPEIQTLLK